MGCAGGPENDERILVALAEILATTGDQERAERVAEAYIAWRDGMAFGIEGFETMTRGPVDYVNRGDPYERTLVYFRGEWSHGCWGDIVEGEPGPYD